MVEKIKNKQANNFEFCEYQFRVLNIGGKYNYRVPILSNENSSLIGKQHKQD